MKSRRFPTILGILVLVSVLLVAAGAGSGETSEDDRRRLAAAVQEMQEEYGHIGEIVYFRNGWWEGQIMLDTINAEHARYVEGVVPRYYKGWPVVVRYPGDDSRRLYAAAEEMLEEYGHIPEIGDITDLWPEGIIIVSTRSQEDARYVALNRLVPRSYKGWPVLVTYRVWSTGSLDSPEPFRALAALGGRGL